MTSGPGSTQPNVMEIYMPGHQPFDRCRRALLGAGGAFALAAALRPWRVVAQTTGAKLPIGVIGSGHIGGTIGGLWVRAGHPVLFSSRHPEELKDMAGGARPPAPSRPLGESAWLGRGPFGAGAGAARAPRGHGFGRAPKEKSAPQPLK